ncbi:MAG: response regulator [Thermodesulfobacteriota bacterium]
MTASQEMDPPLQRPVVLVAEDDEAVRELARKVLVEAGMEVLCTRDGCEAVDRVRAEGGRIRVVVLDLMMPVMDGKTALRKIRRLQPDLPVVVASGLDGRQVLGPELAAQVAVFLRKPYRSVELVEALRRATRGDRMPTATMELQGGRS